MKVSYKALSVSIIALIASLYSADNCLNFAQAKEESLSKDCPLHIGKEGYHKSFAGADKWVKKFDDPARDKWQLPKEVIAALKIDKDDKIADIGAGTGYFSLRIARAYPDSTVYGADVEPDMITYLKQQAKKQHLPNHKAVMLPTDKPALPAKVNLVLVVDTYHHISHRISYFAALKKHLLPDARVAIIDFTAQSPEGPPPEHRLSKADLTEEMKEAGYGISEDVELLPYQYFLVFKPNK
ncbi:MAG: class I SAM-dependent methyltransferase [Candidatus Obscuribacter sp.]|nr:class I SAM-dependent methyltransferase [Candidatus Obscuribacter sp.]